MAIGNEKIYGVIMPNGKMKDISIAKQECEYLNIKFDVIDINIIYSEIIKQTKKITKHDELSDICKINIAPRVRMSMVYSIAAEMGYLVANTSNLSETMIGYSTKWGAKIKSSNQKVRAFFCFIAHIFNGVMDAE